MTYPVQKSIDPIKAAAPGLIVELDENTGNVLIHDGMLGFCVTSNFIHARSIPQIEDAVKRKVSSLLIDNIRAQGLGATEFDEIQGELV